MAVETGDVMVIASLWSYTTATPACRKNQLLRGNGTSEHFPPVTIGSREAVGFVAASVTELYDMSLRQLITVLNGCIKGSNHTRALRLLVTNLPRLTDNYVLRRYAAEILVLLGKEREAGEVYEILVRHFTNAGHPLLAIAAAKQLGEFEMNLGGHLDHIAQVYSRTSAHIDPELPLAIVSDQEGETFDLSGTEPDLPLEALAGVVHEMAIRKEEFASSPDDVPAIPLLSSLDTPSLRQILDELELVALPDDAVLLEAGERAAATVWLVSGMLSAHMRGKSGTSTISAGALVGHRAMIPGFKEPARAQLTALGDVEVLRLGDAALDNVRDEPEVIRAVAGFDLACRVERAIGGSALFTSVPAAERHRLLGFMEARAVPDDSVLIPQGQPGHGLYLVVEGKVDINKSQGDWDMTIKTLGPGDVIGEISLVSEGPAVATALTDGPCRVLYMSRANFDKTCQTYPEILTTVREAAASRLLS